MLKKLAGKRTLVEQALRARALTGKSLARQALEIAQLRRGPGRIYPSEYYEFGLYDDRRFDAPAKARFLGTRLEGTVCEALNSATWDMIEEDKLMTYAALSGVGLPIPTLYAVYHRRGRYFGDVPVLRTPQEVGSFIRESIRFPFFAKPVQSSFGRGGFAVSGYDRQKDVLEFSNGERLRVDDFVDGLDHIEGRKPPELGYILQECLRPHPLLEAATANISSIRLLVLLHDRGPRPFRAIWKVPRRGNMTDNFHHGRSGNMLAWIDCGTGQVERVIAGTGLDQVDVHKHPDTGQALRGLTLPDWPRLIEIGLRASSTFPRLRFLHFDIAMSDRGPVLLEVNVLGSFDLVQLPAPHGLLDGELSAFLARYALPGKAQQPWVRALTAGAVPDRDQGEHAVASSR